MIAQETINIEGAVITKDIVNTLKILQGEHDGKIDRKRINDGITDYQSDLEQLNRYFIKQAAEDNIDSKLCVDFLVIIHYLNDLLNNFKVPDSYLISE